MSGYVGTYYEVTAKGYYTVTIRETASQLRVRYATLNGSERIFPKDALGRLFVATEAEAQAAVIDLATRNVASAEADLALAKTRLEKLLAKYTGGAR